MTVEFVTIELVRPGWWHCVLWTDQLDRVARGEGRSAQDALIDAHRNCKPQRR